MKASGKMSVERFEKEFEKEFGVRIEIKQGGELADNQARLASLRPTDYKGPKSNTFTVSGRMHVKNVKAKLKEFFGIDAELYFNNNVAPGDITLAALRRGDIEKVEMDEAETITKEISFRGSGGEFQYHRLNEKDIKDLKVEYKKDPSDFFLYNLQGGETFYGGELWGGTMGPSPEGLELYDEETEEEIDIDEIDFIESDQISDNDVQDPEIVDFVYVAQGDVRGTIFVDLKNGAEFDSSKLRMEYVTYKLDGWPEKYGSIIHSVYYDDEECFTDIEDDGLEYYKYLIGYIFSDGDFEDYNVIYDTENEDDETIHWDRLNID